MSEEAREAAIPDDLLDCPLDKMSAAQLITAISATRDPQIGAILADKKKFELWIEENPQPRINLRELLDKLRGEKKKYELEPLFDFETRVNPPWIDNLAERIAAKLKGR